MNCWRGLRNFINVTDADFRLFVAWLLGALRPCGPYPILVITGEQGAAKSTAAQVARALIDPNVAPIRTPPREERDLIVAARNAHCVAFDNLSDVPGWLADGFCRLSTGGGYGSRQLHTDLDEVIFDGKRPLSLNGITDLASRPDLADRSIVLTLPAIRTANRKVESAFWREFDIARPGLLGALFERRCGCPPGNAEGFNRPRCRVWLTSLYGSLRPKPRAGLPWARW